MSEGGGVPEQNPNEQFDPTTGHLKNTDGADDITLPPGFMDPTQLTPDQMPTMPPGKIAVTPPTEVSPDAPTIPNIQFPDRTTAPTWPPRPGRKAPQNPHTPKGK